MENEIYSIDMNKDKNLVVYGTNQNQCVIYDIIEDQVVCVFPDFSDSVIFCRFLADDTIFICTIDGTLCTTTIDEEINRVDLGDDITFVDVVKDKILVGLKNGDIYSYSFDLNDQIIYPGNGGEVVCITNQSNNIFSLSENGYIVWEENTCKFKDKLKIIDGITLCNIPNSDVVVIGCPEILLICRGSKVINKIKIGYAPESIVYCDGYIVCGGSSSEISIFSVKDNFKIFSVNLGITGVSKMIPLDDHKVAISTVCGMVGVGDIRKDDGFKFYETSVETVFDFVVRENIFCAVGEKGFDLLDITKIE